METIHIGICHYANALKSAVYGLEEMFVLASRICREQQIPVEFEPVICREHDAISGPFSVIILPPSVHQQDYLNPPPQLTDWLKAQYDQGTRLASACAGAFILAATTVVGTRAITTHWGLAEPFHQQFPQIALNTNDILIDHGDIITAGGLMSWLDLGLELVTQYTSSSVMHQLGKLLVVDTARREQRFYQRFIPALLHGDQAIVTVQQRMNHDYGTPLAISDLAAQANLTERTLQRRFQKATGYNPNQYLQRLRVQKACELLEGSQHPFEWIAHQVGYEDPGACRKAFLKIMGLTPREFRARFSREESPSHRPHRHPHHR
ncbi:GlxA family transcriptional regulator [Photobacterium sp. TY1-4]|uniref:GlxA family transcriptional regulator n=1 Tax=Photobacterium sp. TY1-4 TaxID=2899122 RepID=UPI0021C1AAC1|nr:helix-turn-helix domain-containing protein [Photobacterium sp. TY1-4]UXI03557.1 helix-turn-helix domain-containing protein [Photobacterium sp. TY1-4]